MCAVLVYASYRVFMYRGKPHCYIAVMASIIPAVRYTLQSGMPWQFNASSSVSE
jgi:hypothetical protein